MAKKHIYDKDPVYTILRRWTDLCIRFSYRKAEIHGKSNIPDDGAIILCPNHCNTLMDALVMLRAYPKETVFGARADIFRKPIIAKIMYFLRILPMVRQRDGLRNVLQNNQTQEVIVDTLRHKVRFCLFPEGKHQTKHTLQPLGKGAFRIAIAAKNEFGDEIPVYLVPVGLEYGDYFRYRSTSLINYGKAIDVTSFLKEEKIETEPQAIEALRTELTERISGLITYIPSDENYEAKWALLKMLAVSSAKKVYGDFGTCLYDSMEKNQAIATDIERAMTQAPGDMEKTLKQVEEFEKDRRKEKVSIFSFRKNRSIMSNIMKGINMLIGLPYFIFSAITSLPMWAASAFINSKVKDPAFKNTATFGIKLGMGTVLFFIYLILTFCLCPWWLALSLMALWMPSYSFIYDYIEGCRRWISDIRLTNKKHLQEKFNSILRDFKKL